MDGGAWWAAVHGVAKSRTWLSDFTFTLHFRALEKEMATHSSVLAWRIPGMGEPGGLQSLGSHRVGHDWSDSVAAAAAWEATHTPGATSIEIRDEWNRWVKVCFPFYFLYSQRTQLSLLNTHKTSTTMKWFKWSHRIPGQHVKITTILICEQWIQCYIHGVHKKIQEKLLTENHSQINWPVVFINVKVTKYNQTFKLNEAIEIRQLHAINNLGFSFARKDVIWTTGKIKIRCTDNYWVVL